MRAAALSLVVLCSAALADAGEFLGTLELIPPGCEKGLKCSLKNDFGYLDSEGVGWQAKAGLETDGASIPSWAQPIIGGQFHKEFVAAAIIHDHYCNRHVRSWKKTHWVFYDALLASKVSEEKASLMYFAVYLGGPRWIELIEGETCPVGQDCVRNVPRITWPSNADVKTNEGSRTYIVRKDQYDEPNFAKHLKEAEKLIAERGGKVALQELEGLAQQLSTDDFFLSNRDVIVNPAGPGVRQ